MALLIRVLCTLLAFSLFPVLAGGAAAAEPTHPSAITPLPDIPDTVGTDFWVGFPGSGTSGPQSYAYRVYISATENGHASLSDRTGGPIETRALSAGAVEAFVIDDSYVVLTEDGVVDSGVRITTDVPVSVYVAVFQSAASTGFQAFPIDALGTEHRVLTYNALSGYASRATIIGTQDGTQVTLTPRTALGSHAAGVPYVVTLDEGQIYQIGDDVHGADATGTTVSSTAPVVVYGSSRCAQIPLGVAYCNPVMAQLPPTSAWGTEFLSARFAVRIKGDTYRVLADQDDTAVTVEGTQVATLDAGEFYEAVLPAGVTTPGNQVVHIATSKPALVAQYGNGSTYDGTATGDPLMMLVTPLAQHLTSYTVATPDIVGTGQAWLNVLAQTRDVGHLTLDGVRVPAESFTDVSAGTGYSVAQLSVGIGQHTLTSPHQFGLQVYAWGNNDAYGYPGGSAMAPVADAPAPPVATALASSGNGVTPQSVTVPIGVQQEVRLLDGAALVDTIDVPGQGTYVLDPATGVITFTPLLGFSGTATPATYVIADAWNQQSDNTYTPTVNAPAAPVAVPLTSSGKGTQSVSVAAPAGGSVALVDGGADVTTVTVPQGTYLLDTTTDPATISFVPDAGFTGRASPATYRLIDAYNQTSTSTYTPRVLGTVKPPPVVKDPRARLQLPRNAVVGSGSKAHVKATCKVRHGKARTCAVTLYARLNGDLAKVGHGTVKGKKVQVRLNAVGRSLAATPGGTRMQGRMVVKTTKGKQLRDVAWTKVVAKRFTLVRPAYFDLGRATYQPRDRTYLRGVGKRVGKVTRVICTGYADSTGTEAFNQQLGKRRAKATCAALKLPKRVKVVIRTLGERHPVATNTTAEGRARNRRATITLVY